MLTQYEIDKDYVDSPEAARILNVDDSRIRRLCLDGRFEGAIKAGKSWLIPRISVMNFKRLRPRSIMKTPNDRTIISNAIREATNLKGCTDNG